MTTFTYDSSLLETFQSLLEKATRKRPMRCCGITNKKARCRRRIQAAKKSLSVLCREIIEVLVRGTGDIKNLLAQAAPLLMCTQNHQGYAATQVGIWLEKMTFLENHHLLDDDEAKPILLLSPNSLSKIALPTVSASAELKAEVITSATLQIEFRPSTPSKESTSYDPGVHDSGYKTEEDEEAKTASPVLDLPSVHAGSVLARNPFMTPTKTPLAVLSDSGISLKFENHDIRLGAPAVEPTSPSAGRSKRSRRHAANTPLSHLAKTAVQTRKSKKAADADSPLLKPSPRTYQYLNHPAKELVKYIKKPLCKTAEKDGFIYSFQLENDWNLNKIGTTKQGENNDTLKGPVTRRMKEHKRCGWPDPKVTLERPMPHAHRVEQIIGKHLGYCRVKECGMTKGLNGKECRHEFHREWFKVSLDVIHEVVRAWERWIKTNPYVERDGVFKLKPEWESRLEEVLKIDPQEKDYWLQWLRQFAPPEDSPVKTQTQVMAIAKPKDLDGNKVSSSTIITAVEITSHEDNSDSPPASKTTLQRRDTFIKRLKSVQTWPRVLSTK